MEQQSYLFEIAMFAYGVYKLPQIMQWASRQNAITRFAPTGVLEKVESWSDDSFMRIVGPVREYAALYASQAITIFMVLNRGEPFSVADVPQVPAALEPFLFLIPLIFGIPAMMRRAQRRHRVTDHEGTTVLGSQKFKWPVLIAWGVTGWMNLLVVVLIWQGISADMDSVKQQMQDWAAANGFH